MPNPAKTQGSGIGLFLNDWYLSVWLKDDAILLIGLKHIPVELRYILLMGIMKPLLDGLCQIVAVTNN